MTKTEHYQLNQWDPSDQVRRTDFNEDNAKIEQALAGQAEEAGQAEQRFHGFLRNFGDYAHILFAQAIANHSDTQTYTHIRSLFLETFDTQDNIASLEGNLNVSGGSLVLGWGNPPSTMTTMPIDLTGVTWSRVVAWVRGAPNVTYTMAVNGVPLVQTAETPGKTVKGTACTELQLEADVPQSSSATVALTLAPIEENIPRVYEYGVLFY